MSQLDSIGIRESSGCELHFELAVLELQGCHRQQRLGGDEVVAREDEALGLLAVQKFLPNLFSFAYVAAAAAVFGPLVVIYLSAV